MLLDSLCEEENSLACLKTTHCFAKSDVKKMNEIPNRVWVHTSTC